MAINPDALLIFRAREGKDEKQKPKEKLKESILPKEEKEKSLGTFKPDRNIEPMLIPSKESAKQDMIKSREEAKSKIAVVKESVQQQSPKQNEMAEPQAMTDQPPPLKKASNWRDHITHQEYPDQKAQAEPLVAQSEPQKEKETKDINLLGYKIFRKNAKPKEEEQQGNVYEQQNLSYKDVASSGSSINIFANRDYISKRSMGRSKSQLNRDSARGRKCVWHPWREAYAICAYCHRPFCFEDTIEYNKDYYCLEDIDNVSSTYKEKIGSSGNTVGVIAGVLLLVAFLTFFYFANNQIIYVLTFVNSVGIFYFASHLNYSYLFALLATFLMIFAFIVAMQMFLQSKRRYFSGIIICISSVVLFSYQFSTSGTTYLGILDGLMFVAFFALLYSRATITLTSNSDSLVVPNSAMERNLIRWPNAGKF
jgi:hypothetical protein